MKKSVYAVFDIKSSVFANPFICVNDQVAIRNFNYAAQDENSDLFRYPNDFLLYHLGTYDDATGIIDPLAIPAVIAHNQSLGGA